jgi:ABC-2 type transport system ATP-binding protein
MCRARPPRNAPPVIELRQLTKRYGRTTAVDGLTFTVRPGRVTGFLGPNGAGKSTTLRMLLGLDRPTRGDALIGGKAYRDLPEPSRHVGALLDAGARQDGRTARHHLTWLARAGRIPLRRVGEVLDLVGLAAVADRRTRTFSLGMGQRLGLAAALLGDPEVLLLDEPVNGLDPEGVRWIRTLLKDLAGEGRTVFVSSHLMSEMAITADHLVVIGRGRLLADTGVAEFVDRRAAVVVRARDPERLRALLVDEGLDVEREPDGALSATGAPASRIGEVAAAHGITLDELGTRPDSLEDAFFRLTGGTGA